MSNSKSSPSEGALLQRILFYVALAVKTVVLKLDRVLWQGGEQSPPGAKKRRGRRGRKGLAEPAEEAVGAEAPGAEAPAVEEEPMAEAPTSSGALEDVPEGTAEPCGPRGAASKKNRVLPSFVEDVCLTEQGPTSHAAQVRALSMEAFDEDATRPQVKGEKLVVMLVEGEVLGYVTYTVRPSSRSMNVLKFAVARAHRRRGLGRSLIKYLIQQAKQRRLPPQPGQKGGKAAQLETVCLSSLPTSVAFYKACGFRAEEVKIPGADADDLVEDQVYMEYPLLRKRRR